MTYDSILLVAFGGPTPGCCKRRETCLGEPHCFVEGILGSTPVRAQRVQTVVDHYRQLGGFSPFDAMTLLQAQALSRTLASQEISVPVRVGMRHWAPWLKDVLKEISQAGERRILAIIMAPHQSPVSWDWYQQVVSEGCAALGEDAPSVDYLDPWPTHPGFLRASAESIRAATGNWAQDRLEAASLVFSAHAIPESLAVRSPYVRQVADTAALVAEAVGKPSHIVAYQSQATDRAVRWSEPDIHQVIDELATRGVKDVIVSPIGFLCENVEVLFDLDVAARATAKARAMTFTRTCTVGAHPAFIQMLAGLVASRFAATR